MTLLLIFLTLFGSLFILFFIPKIDIKVIQKLTLFSTGFVFILSCFLLINFKKNYYSFQDIQIYNLGFEYLNLYIVLGLDGLSLLFFVLSSFFNFLMCAIYLE